MSIKCLKEFCLSNKNLLLMLSTPVNIGDGKVGNLFVYSEDFVDPGEEYYHHPKDTLKFAMFGPNGEKMWEKDLGQGVLPGVWFCPVLPLDLDQDGIDEIYFVNNLSELHPFTMVYRYLEAISPLTGETIDRWQWPMNTFEDRMSLCYRFYLVAGYSKGEPVLITSQGTYGDMYLQAYGPGMTKKWERKISKDEKGPKASHITPVIDFNDDGIDELFWGERLISLEDGNDVMCFDKSYYGHSDILIPFVDYDTGKKYLFTGREGYDEIPPRVVTFNEDGSKAWEAIDQGHIHYGWIANINIQGKNRRIAMAMKIVQSYAEQGVAIDDKVEYYFDAYTGEVVLSTIPFKGADVFPIDINGDGYSEFFCYEGENKGWILDSNGNKIFKISEDFESHVHAHKNGYILDEYKCEQLMLSGKDGIVRIYGDTNAKGSEIFNYRHNYKGYHKACQKLMASGYNNVLANSTCGI